MKKRKLFFICIMALILTVLTTVPCFAVPEEGYTLHGTTALFSKELIHWDFEYSDSFFDHSPEEYDHKLARASLGMAVSSYRNLNEENRPKDAWITEYLTDAGFTNLRSECYDITPDEHSVASMIGSKKIGQTTVLAVVPCGGNYLNEWLSNFTIGTEIRHQGFEEAAFKVEERIDQYIEDYNIQGSIKLWVSGYSRGAAVANIVEADMTQTGRFRGVYGYNFATPRTTKEKGNFKNIFNILGKNDPVTMIPFAEWGYERYGVELFTPAQEMDSFYYEKASGANEIAHKLIRRDFTNNPEINGQLRMLLEYLLQILPTDEDYQLNLEESLKKAWVSDSVDKLLESVGKAVENMRYLTAEQKTEADAMLNYLDNVVMAYLKGNRQRLKDGYWNDKEDWASNLIREHNPSTYIEWMYSSDNPEDIFTDSLLSKKVIITGTAIVDVYGEDGFVESIDEDGNISYQPPEGEISAGEKRIIYAVHKGSQCMITLPGDMVYKLKIHVPEDETLGYIVSTYTTSQLSAKNTKLISFNGKEGDDFLLTVNPKADYPVLTYENGGMVTSWPSSVEYTPAMILQLENLNVFNISLGAMLGILLGAFVFLILTIVVVIIVSIVHAITCRRRGKPYSKYHVIVPHLLLALLFFLMGEMSGYMLNAVSIIGAIYMTISNLILTLLAIRGTIRHRCKRNTVIWTTLLILTVAGFFLQYYTGFGAINTVQFITMGTYFILASVAAAFTFPHEGKHYQKKEKSIPTRI